MQALKTDINPGSQLKSVKGSKNSKCSKESSKTKEASSKDKKFAEVYGQLMGLPQTAVLESKVTQLGTRKGLNQTVESTGKNQLLSTALGQEIGSTAKKSKIMANEAKLISTGLSKQASNEDIKSTGDEAKLIKAEMKKGSAAAEAKALSSAANPISNETSILISDESKLIKTGEQKVSPAEEIKISGSATKPVSNETSKLINDESKLVKAGEQKLSSAEETKVSGSTAKPISNETVKPVGDESKLVKAEGKQASEAEEVKSVKPEIKGSHSGEAKDTPGEVGRAQSDINSSQVSTGKTEADKSIMSKSQVDSIVSNMAGQIKNGASSLEVNLKPEYLGKIKLMLELIDGSLSVRIVAQTGEALNLLNSSLQSIKDSLELQGIKLTEMSVDLANQEKQGKQTGNGYKEESKPGNLFRGSKESYDSIGSWEQNPAQSYNLLNILA